MDEIEIPAFRAARPTEALTEQDKGGQRPVRCFEQRRPYPSEAPRTPRALLQLLWEARAACGPILGMTLLTATIGAFEALLFALLGRLVDWLGQVPPSQIWDRHGERLLWLGAIVLGSVGLVALQTMLKHQTLAGNFPMRLRWNFHRLMLGQGMAFYQDEFAGRVAAKVMQTALAVRDTCMTLADILVFVTIYFVTMVAVLGAFDAWMLLPFLGWVALYAVSLRWFVPRLSRVSRAQADARALMTGRITDAYTNIATVKLFSHAGREAGYARSAMQEFMLTVHGQMRLVSSIEIVNHLLSMGLIVSTAGVALWLWEPGPGRHRRGRGGQRDGAAPQRHVALGDVGDGLAVRACRHGAGWHQHAGAAAARARPPGRFPAAGARGEIRFERVSFAYGQPAPGRSRAGSSATST